MDYIAVIDIGMTNKKVAVYDGNLVQLDARYRNFPPKMVDGIETHDLQAMEDWFVEQLAYFAKKYPIKAIAVSTHGATFVCVGAGGIPSVPCIYYTYEPGDDFHRQFYERLGSPAALQARTGTPYLKSMINTAKGIFFAQQKYPEEFKNTVHVLMYPQYWGYRFTGKTGAEGTYMGCHAYLWDQIDNRLSSVADELGVSPLMPPKLNCSWDVLGTITEAFAEKTGLAEDVIVTMGIHDSNSSLLPHFAKKGETGFLLNSTGTWCVSMNPVAQYGFAPDELGKVVFFNISAFGKPVKTGIFLGGQEFETWSKVLMDIHKRADLPGYDEELYRRVLREKQAFLTPELSAGSGQFPLSKPRVVEDGRDYHYGLLSKGKEIPPCFKNYETGFALLRISLVMQSLTAVERIGLVPGEEVFTEGGFRKNKAYNVLLSSALKDNPTFLTDIAEASAFGAAMTAKMALTGQGLSTLAKDFEIEYQEVAKADIPELFPYRAAWLKLAQ
ncbi:carbohydrate kinase [Spirochaetia bacterium]|nr:carbohydrate kinase [Spirochaetia bacterium]